MTILEKIDELKRRLDLKDELKERDTENNKAISVLKKELADMMLDEEVTKVTRGGISWSIVEKTRYSKKAGMEDELFEALRAEGLGPIIKETVNAQTLQGAMSNLADENGGDLPERFSKVVNTYTFYDFMKRKA